MIIITITTTNKNIIIGGGQLYIRQCGRIPREDQGGLQAYHRGQSTA